MQAKEESHSLMPSLHLANNILQADLAIRRATFDSRCLIEMAVPLDGAVAEKEGLR